MKQPVYKHQTRKDIAVIALCLAELMSICKMHAQTSNVLINDVSDNNTYANFNANVNVIRRKNFHPGPNGTGSVVHPGNIQIINNQAPLMSGGPNVRGIIAAPAIQQAINKPINVSRPKPKQPAMKAKNSLTAHAQRPKPKQVITKAPVKPVIAQRPKIKPAAGPKPVLAVAAPAVSHQAPLQAIALNNDVVNSINLPVLPVQQIMNQGIASQAVIAKPISVQHNLSKNRTSSLGIASSGSNEKSRRSGHRKHGKIYYEANKKLAKLFAKTRKAKFDPAKCFVWR